MIHSMKYPVQNQPEQHHLDMEIKILELELRKICQNLLHIHFPANFKMAKIKKVPPLEKEISKFK